MLSDGDVHVWLLPYLPKLPEALLDFVTDEEKQRAETMSSVRRKNEWLASRALLRACLLHYTDCAPQALQFEKTEAGKPVLADPISNCAFNLSHSSRWIACAVVRAQCVGIDVDCDTRRNRTDDIAKQYFHPTEQEVLQNLSDEAQRKQQFFRYWTLKEAYIKACGTTISGARLHDMGFAVRDEQEPEALFELPVGNWHFKHWCFDRDHHLSLACCWQACETGRDVVAPQYHFWQWDPSADSQQSFAINEFVTSCSP